MTQPQNNAAPKLDRPGAGLPWYHYILTRFIVGPFASKKTKWEDDAKLFHLFNRKIINDIAHLTPEQMERPVLVPKQFGLEDSSRYWSVAMTLEHLVIVGRAMSYAIVQLSNGTIPDMKVDTARVKPSPQAKADVSLAAFRAMDETLLADIESRLGDRMSPASLVHPWFGPFTARQFHWLLAQHSGIHLKQIRNIVARL